jgi:hypothetical protein
MKNKKTYTKAEVITLLCELGLIVTTESILTHTIAEESTPEEYAYINVAHVISDILALIVDGKYTLYSGVDITEYRNKRSSRLTELILSGNLDPDLADVLRVLL